MIALPVDPKAFALRAVRVDIKNNRFINYEGTTFPKNPQSGWSLMVRRMAAFGFIVKESDFVLDVLDEEGDIIQDFSISREGFEYLRSKLKFRREHSEVRHPAGVNALRADVLASSKDPGSDTGSAQGGRE